MVTTEEWFEEKLGNLGKSLGDKLDAIHTQTLKTNGRVNALEEETSIVRFFYRNPKICIFAIIVLLMVPRSVVSAKLIELIRKTV